MRTMASINKNPVAPPFTHSTPFGLTKLLRQRVPSASDETPSMNTIGIAVIHEGLRFFMNHNVADIIAELCQTEQTLRLTNALHPCFEVTVETK